MYNQADRCSSCTRTLAMMVNMPHVIKCAHERDIFLIASHSCFDPEFQCETSKRNNCMSSYSPAVQSVEVRTSLVSHAKKTVNDVSTSISAAFTQDAHAHRHNYCHARNMPYSITHIRVQTTMLARHRSLRYDRTISFEGSKASKAGGLERAGDV